MERVSPVRLAFLQTLTAWLCCCKGPKHQNHNSTCASLMALVPRSSGLPVALSAPRHGDFPRSISGSKLPVCSLRGHAFPALKEICEVKCNLQIAAQSYNVKVPMSLPKWICYQSSHHTSSHKRVLLSIVYSTVCLLIVCLAQLRIQKTRFEVCASAKHLLEEGMERVSPVRLAFLQTLAAWLCCCKGPKHQNHNSTCASLMALVPRSSGLPVALSAPRHGDFPRSISGSKLPVCSLRGHAFPALKEICEVKCNLQIAAQSYNVKVPMSLPKWICYQSSHHTSSHKRVLLSIVYSTVCLLIVCLAQLRIQKTRFEVCLCQTSVGRGHGKSEPRSVGVLANAHGMTLLLQRTKTPEPQLHLCFADGSSAKVFRSPSGTFCPKARGLSPQHIWEQAPCVFAAWPCFSCPQRNLWSEMQPPNSCAKLQRQSSNVIAKMNLLPIQPSYKQPQARPAFNCV